MLDLSRLISSTVVEYPYGDILEESGLVLVKVPGVKDAIKIKTLESNDTNAVFAGLSILDKFTIGQKPFLRVKIVITATGRAIFPHSNIHNKSLQLADGSLVSGWLAEGPNWIDLPLSYAGQTLYASYHQILSPLDKSVSGMSPIASASILFGTIAASAGYTQAYISTFANNVIWKVDDPVYAVADDPLDPYNLFAGFVTNVPTNVFVGTCVSVPTPRDPWLGIEYINVGMDVVTAPALILLQSPGNVL